MYDAAAVLASYAALAAAAAAVVGHEVSSSVVPECAKNMVYDTMRL